MLASMHEKIFRTLRSKKSKKCYGRESLENVSQEFCFIRTIRNDLSFTFMVLEKFLKPISCLSTTSLWHSGAKIQIDDKDNIVSATNPLNDG